MIAQRPENNYLMLQTNCKLAALPRRSRRYEFHRLKNLSNILKNSVYFGHLQIPSARRVSNGAAADPSTEDGGEGRGHVRGASRHAGTAGSRDCPKLDLPIRGRALSSRFSEPRGYGETS